MVIGLLSATLLMSVVSLFSFRQIAFRYGLVDKPTIRKQHQGDIPFIGGIALFVTIFLMQLISSDVISNQSTFVFCSFIIVLMGTWDDKFELSPSIRLFILTAISLYLVFEVNISMSYLGNLLGTGEVWIHHGNSLLTILAIIGCVTAFNMIDGIDGLFGIVSCIAFASMGWLFYDAGNVRLACICLFFIVALIPYMLCNLGLLPNHSCKVFMGDGGTLFIGFSIIWLLIEGSQSLSLMSGDDEIDLKNDNIIIRASTALWIIAIPLMDMVMVMVRRMRKRQSPFKADRLHIHYICQRLGLSSRTTLLVISLLSLLCACIGIVAQIMLVPNYVMFYLFLTTFAGYMYVMKHIWRISVWIRSQYSDHTRIRSVYMK